MKAAEALLELLPEDGTRVVYGELMRRADGLYLSAGFAGELLGLLCTMKRAAVETINGWQFARRTLAAEVATDFPLRRRPYRPPPRFIRRAPRELPARGQAGGAR